jgi:hypothetical protein
MKSEVKAGGEWRGLAIEVTAIMVVAIAALVAIEITTIGVARCVGRLLDLWECAK